MRTPLSVVVWTIAIATLAAQEGQAPRDPQDTPQTIRVSTNLIRVDMYATRKDEAVTDLRADEVDVFDDGVRQKIETFEFVHVDAETTAAVAGQNRNDRARIFIIFIDTYSVRLTGRSELRLALLRFLDRMLLPNDLVGLMTPDMSAGDLVLGRRATVISDLANDARWLESSPDRVDPKEYAWENCFGNRGQTADMRRRRRARVTLDALQDLAAYLGVLREERKAVLYVTRPGALQFRDPSPESLALQHPDERLLPSERSKCDADWRALQKVNYGSLVTQLSRSANRANVSFYPVDGTFVPGGPNRPGGSASRRNLRFMTDSEDQLQRLAKLTDGLAEGWEDFEEVTDRIVRDTSSYYLLSYQLPAARIDNAYHAITVKVKRSGVNVRARAGYGGETAKFVKRETSSKSVPAPPAIDSRITSAFEGVRRFESLTPVWLRTSGFVTSTDQHLGGAFWVVGEAGAAAQALKSGTAEVIVTTPDKQQVFSRTLNLTGAETFDLRVPETGTLPFGTYGVRVRIRGTDEKSSAMVQDLPRVELAAAASGLGEPILWRRGPLARDSYQQTADPRFRRTERLRLEYATDVRDEPVARLLDRMGQPLQVPVQLTARAGPDDSGMRWIVADLLLTAFAPGDYAVSLSQGSKSQVTAFRIIP